MKIYNSNGVEILDVEVDDTSVRNRVIMGDHNLTLRYSLPEHVELPIGAYCVYEAVTYTLKRPENLKMKHSRDFEYTVLLESPQADTKIWKFRNTVDGRLKFPLTAKPHEHLQMLIDNLNRRGNGWTVGDCIDDVEHLISYDHDYCWDALGKMAEEFKTEFEIDNKCISLKKVEYNKDNPLTLSYGKGNGFRSGVARSSSDTPPVEFLFVQGGDKNIDRSKYGSDRAANGSPVLLLPKNVTISYDGEYFEDEEGFDSTNARTYSTDNYGLCIFRSNAVHTSYAEDSIDCSDIYPKREGRVSSVVTVNAQKNLYDIVDSSIPSTLNYSDCLIEGEKLTIEFQSGMLAGHGEFEVNYYHTSVSGKAARRFEIVPKDEDGVIMPNETFKPVGGTNGDKYAVFKCMLPAAYICDNSTKTGAEWEMFRAAVKYMYEHEEEEFSFKGQLDSIWASQDWLNIGGRIVLGGYVLFSDTRFQPNGVLVRITGIKDYVNKPHKPEIELSNKTATSGFKTALKLLESQEVLSEDYHRDAISYTKRRFRDARETMEMLSALIGAGFDNFTENITPINIQTMQILLGDESLQFRFVSSTTTPTPVDHAFTWNNSTKKLSTTAGIVQHMTLGIDDISSRHAASDYKYWNVYAWESGVLNDGTKRYYLYLFADKENGIGEYHLSETPMSMESVSGFYLFLVGVLNSEYDGGRSFVPLYGFTEILPGRITTDRIVSGDGNSYFDMLNNALKLGNALDFNSQGDGKLRIKGTLVQSQSDSSESPIGCYRGVYSPSTTYYNGDEVSYTTANGATSTYRYINNSPSSGHAPTETLYWQVLSAGAEGARGASAVSAFKSIVFKRSATSPSTPTGGTYASPVPAGWSDGVPSGEEKLWMSTRVFKSDGTADAQWAEPRQLTDTADLDIVFSSVENPSSPSGHPNENTQWSETADDSTIWMATSKKSNGTWGNWQVMRIKGEDGTDGTSITVKGACYNHYETEEDWEEEKTTTEPLVLIDSVTDPDTEEVTYNIYWKYGRPRPGWAPGWRQYEAQIGESFVMQSDGHLWMADIDGWKDIGQFRGERGATGDAGQNAYVHIKFANSATTNDWTSNNGETPGAYIGICTDNNAADPTAWNAYTWTKWQGEDGFGYQYIYKRTTGYVAPSLPSSSAPNYQDDDYVPTGWTDDPTDVTLEQPYEWMCYRKKIGGVWSSYIGNNNLAVLWAKYGKDGTNCRIVGTALGHFTDMTAFNAVKSELAAGLYLIDVVNGEYNKVASLTASGIVGLSTATDGEGYIMEPTGHLFSTSTNGWQDVGMLRGSDGIGVYKSTAFIRLPNEVSSVDVPTGGNWDSPLPTSNVTHDNVTYSWSDTIPNGDLVLWATTRKFYSNGTSSSWSTPRKMTDTTSYDVEFAKKQAGDSMPVAPSSSNTHGCSPSSNQIWFDPVLDDTEDFTQMYWRAERECRNGSWEDWVITRIKGEKGDDAETYELEVSSLTIKREAESMIPGSVTWKVVHVKGGSRDDVNALPAGWYMKLTKRGTGGSNTSNPITNSSVTIAAGTLFGWEGLYSNAVMILYDENDHFISSADVSLVINGQDGAKGDYTEIRYAANGSTSQAPSLNKTSLNPSGWGTAMPVVGSLQYLWMTSAVKSGDGTTLVSQWKDPIRITPRDGRDGMDGQDAAPKYTWIMYADDASGGGISNDPVDGQGNFKKYIGFAYNKNTAVESTNPSDYRWSLFKGANGRDGIDGENGADGQTLYTWIKYATSLSTGGYPTYIYDEPNASTKYIGIATNKTTSVESSDPQDYKWSKFRGDDGVDGTDGTDGRDGQDGRDGRGITNVVEYYAVSNNRYVAPTEWSTEVQTISAENRYLWKKERVYYSSGTPYEESTPVVIGAYGDTGTGISSVTGMYLATSLASGVTKNTIGWSSSVQSVSRENPFLYNYNIILYSNGDRRETEISLIGHWGADGQDGADGRDGASAASIFRGNYSAQSTYYGFRLRVDIVKYGDEYFVSRSDAPNGDSGFTGVPPTNRDYWNSFGASFESVATALLLAELANIAGFIFRNNRLESQKLANGQTTIGETTDAPMVFLDGANGRASFAGGKVVFNADGTVNIGNGKFVIDANGNVTMSNINASNGTFGGILSATGGLRLPCSGSSAQYDWTPNSATSVHINWYSGAGDNVVYLPSNPIAGQSIFIRFSGGVSRGYQGCYYRISGNGKTIFTIEGNACSQFVFMKAYGTAYLSNYNIDVLTPYGGHAVNPCAQLIYDGTNWHIVSASHATIINR